MTKEQRDLAWACLPKEARKEIRTLYQHVSKNPRLDKYDSVYLATLEDVFDQHNLTSDNEPEEMLMAKEKSVMTALCRAANLQNDKEEDWIRAGEEIEFTLAQIFGDKYLPDKEEPKPKFKVGDKVKIILCTHPEYRNKVGIITSIDSCGNPYVKVDGIGTLFHAPYALEPYTKESRNLSQETANCDKPEDNQLKNNMEEKELNLLELLKGCEGMKIFLPDDGYVTINAFGYESIEVKDKDGHIYNLVDKETLRIRSTGFAYLYPSQESFEQNPLNAAKAWQEWKEARKPKRWRAKVDMRYWYIDSNLEVHFGREDGVRTDDKRYDYGNYFRTKEAAQQATEAVREALAKFHEESPEK